jgi:hypothetical protein
MSPIVLALILLLRPVTSDTLKLGMKNEMHLILRNIQVLVVSRYYETSLKG